MNSSRAIAQASGKVIPSPAPVELDGIRYEALNHGRDRGLDQNGGYIAAIEVSSNRELWTLCVYEINYHEEMPVEPQEVYIMRMRIMGNNVLHVWDDFGEHFVVDTILKTSRKLDF
jgi:hypothetical protein